MEQRVYAEFIGQIIDKLKMRKNYAVALPVEQLEMRILLLEIIKNETMRKIGMIICFHDNKTKTPHIGIAKTGNEIFWRSENGLKTLNADNISIYNIQEYTDKFIGQA